MAVEIEIGAGMSQPQNAMTTESTSTSPTTTNPSLSTASTSNHLASATARERPESKASSPSSRPHTFHSPTKPPTNVPSPPSSTKTATTAASVQYTSCTSRRKPPDHGSFAQMIAANPRACYTIVEQWRPEQLDRLDCHILPIEPFASSGVHIETDADPDDWTRKTINQLVLQKKSLVHQNEDALFLFRYLVPLYQPHLKQIKRPGAHLYFNRKSVARVPCSLLFRSETHPAWVIAFVSQFWLLEHRRRFVKPHKSWPPTSKACKNTEFFDPYYAGLMIAIAQSSRTSESGDTIPVHLFSPFLPRPLFLVHHSANIPVRYLQKFDRPRKFTDCGFTIRRTEISFEQLPHLIETLDNICTMPSRKRKLPLQDATNTNAKPVLSPAAKQQHLQEDAPT